MKKKWLIVTVILLCLFLVGFSLFAIKNNNNQPSHTVKINNVSINLETANSDEEKAKGLCCRSKLDPNSGMLFIYDKPGIYNFWMKDTLIPLDIIWIDSSKKIIHIEQDVKPSSYPKSFGPSKNSKYVIEVNAGFTKKHNIKIGDQVNF